MPFDVAIMLAGFILVTTLIVMGAIVISRKQAAREEELKRAASARGWKFEATREKGYRIHRWTGSTDGVSWVAESLAQTTGGHKQQRLRHIARWHGSWNPGISGAVVAMGMPKGKERLGHSVATGGGLFARLAQKAVGFAFDKAIDDYFGDVPGKEVDAAALQGVDAKVPGFVVMAADKDEGARVLSQGLENALLTAVNDQGSVLADDKNRPWVLLRPTAISLARLDRFRNAGDVESFVRAGVALTRTSRFSRPLS